MLNDPLPIMDSERVVQIIEKPRLKYIQNEEEYRLLHNTTYEKFIVKNNNNNQINNQQNRNFSLVNFTIENTKNTTISKGNSNQNTSKQTSLSANKSKKKSNKFKSSNGQIQSYKQSQNNMSLSQRQQQDMIDQDKKDEQFLKYGEQEYIKDHECYIEQQQTTNNNNNNNSIKNRCKQCNSTMKYIYHSTQSSSQQLINQPYSIYYVDYFKIFSRKMDSYSLPKSKQKQFLMINYLPYMREWSFYILDRPKYYGIEEFIYNYYFSNIGSQNKKSQQKVLQQQNMNQQELENNTVLSLNQSNQHQQQQQLKLRVPFSLSLQFPIRYSNKNNQNNNSQSQYDNITDETMEINNNNKDKLTQQFETFSILGNYESSNISYCTVNKQENKCQLLLKSDTNTKGCLHWFMFTVVYTNSKQNNRNKNNSNINNSQSNPSTPQSDRSNNILNNNQSDLDNQEQQQNQDEKTIQFSILNNQRNGYLYREGMQIAIFDSTKPEKGWHRGADNIFYYKSNVDHQFFQPFGSSGNNKTLNKTPQPSINSNNNQQSLIGNNNINQSQNQNNMQISDQNEQMQNTQNNLAFQQQQYQQQPQIQSQVQQSSSSSNNKRQFQTMDFSYNFSEQGQRVTFAYCYPYSLTDLNNYLEQQEQKLICSFLETQNLDSDKKQFTIQTNKILYKKSTLTSSRLGLPVILLKITSSKNPKLTKNKKKKKVIFIISRQHPGETPASFVCEGFISFLLSDTIQSRYLLENYIFKIVPMMNPDGVVVGNSRCNISGSDLNRKWDNPDPILHPEVYQVKNEIKKSHQKREVAIFCDLHGHSMKKHAFFYGCNKASDGGVGSWTQVRLLPRILSKKSSFFSLNDCKFRVTEDKKNTARVICWNELKISNSFTLETSFFGYDDLQNDGKPTHFTVEDLCNLGRKLCESILEYSLVMEMLTAELIESKGWLKPSRLLQVTGDSAQSKIMKNIKFQKKLDKQQRVQNNLNNIQQEKEKQQAQIWQSIRSREKRCLTPSIINNNNSNNQKVQSQNSSFINNENKTKSNLSLEERISNKNQLENDDDEKYGNEGNNKNKKQFSDQSELLQQLCPSMKSNWRDYFGKEELERTFKKIDKGEDPNDQEVLSGSDSEAEIDIFKGNELQQSNDDKNRKKAKKKRQSFKKETANQFNNNNKDDLDQITSALLDPLKKKKQSSITATTQSAAAQSLERNRWNPSPLIQNYKQQLEIKKQQLKKQSYPIAKVGQSFSSAYQQQQQQQQNSNNNSECYAYQSTQASCTTNNSSALPQQQTYYSNKQPVFYSPQAPPNVIQTNILPQNLASKNSINNAYAEKRLLEMQQQQQQSINQSLINPLLQSRNSQNTIYECNNKINRRKSGANQIEEKFNQKGIIISNSEAANAFRLNTSDLQPFKIISDRNNDSNNIYNNTTNFANFTKHSLNNNQKFIQNNNNFAISTQKTQQSLQSSTKHNPYPYPNSNEIYYQSNQEESDPIISYGDDLDDIKSDNTAQINNNNNYIENSQKQNKQSLQSNHQNKLNTPKPFIIDDDDEDEENNSQSNKYDQINNDSNNKKRTDNLQNNSNNFENSNDRLIQYKNIKYRSSQKKINQQDYINQEDHENNHNSSVRYKKNKVGTGSYLLIKNSAQDDNNNQEEQNDDIEDNDEEDDLEMIETIPQKQQQQQSKQLIRKNKFDQYLQNEQDNLQQLNLSQQSKNNKNREKCLSIPHNFVSTSSSKQELQPFAFEEQINSQYSSVNKNNNINQKLQQQCSSSNSDSYTTNPENDMIITKIIHNVNSQYIKDNNNNNNKQRNSSNFEKKIKPQQSIIMKINHTPDKSNQQKLFPSVVSQSAYTNYNNSDNVNNNQQSFGRNQDRIIINSFNINNNSNNNNINNSIEQNKTASRKLRAKSINDGKLQSLNYPQNYNYHHNHYEKSSDQYKLQQYIQENTQSFIPFKNFSSYNNNHAINSNNIRIRKLNIQ